MFPYFGSSLDVDVRIAPQGDKAAKDVKTFKGTLEFPDLTNGDVDNGKFESDVSAAPPQPNWVKRKCSVVSVAIQPDGDGGSLRAGTVSADTGRRRRCGGKGAE